VIVVRVAMEAMEVMAEGESGVDTLVAGAGNCYAPYHVPASAKAATAALRAVWYAMMREIERWTTPIFKPSDYTYPWTAAVNTICQRHL
jgi:hypothetical protein